MITAQEASRQSKGVLHNFATTEMRKIEKDIMNAIKEGRFSISGDGYLQEETRYILSELGYRVKTGTQYNEPWYSISW